MTGSIPDLALVAQDTGVASLCGVIDPVASYCRTVRVLVGDRKVTAGSTPPTYPLDIHALKAHTRDMTTTEAIASYVVHLNTLKPDYATYRADRPGQKVTRIIATLGGHESVHSFVDNTTGDLFKADGYKRPAKGIRGNLVTGLDDVIACADWSGRYLYAR